MGPQTQRLGQAHWHCRLPASTTVGFCPQEMEWPGPIAPPKVLSSSDIPSGPHFGVETMLKTKENTVLLHPEYEVLTPT